MPLGSESALGLAGPNGTPLIGELPTPADPAGGVSCAKACAGTVRLPSAKTRTSAELRDMQVSPGCSFNDDVVAAFPPGRQPRLFPGMGLRRSGAAPRSRHVCFTPKSKRPGASSASLLCAKRGDLAWLPIRYWLPAFLCVAVSPFVRILA